MIDSAQNKTKKEVAVAAAGIACNALLSAAKIAAGFLFGMISLVADGFNNLGDCGSGVVSLVSACIAAKPADKQHPYGHRRAEYVAAMITGFLVLAVAVGLLDEAVNGVIDGVLNEAGWIVYVVLGASLAVKAAMFVFYRRTAKSVGSDSLAAAAVDSLCDCVATAAVVLGAVLAEFGVAADGWAGIAVALFVGWQGVRIVREASSKLLGQAPDADQVNRIKSVIFSHDEVLGLHDLRVFTYGAGASYATVHIEMDASIPAMQSHAVLDEIEHEVRKTEGVELTAHLDPVDTRDEQVAHLEQAVRKAAEKVVEGVDIHDFRIIRGAVDKLVFDAGVPFDCKLKDEEIAKRIVDAAESLGDYEAAVTVERE